MKHFDFRDFLGGVLLIGLGLFVAIYAGTHYRVGEPARMGPGFFPVSLGCILAGLGLIVLLLSFRPSAHAWEVPSVAFRPLIAILTAVAVFGLIVYRLGLVPATVALTFIAALAEPRLRLAPNRPARRVARPDGLADLHARAANDPAGLHQFLEADEHGHSQRLPVPTSPSAFTKRSRSATSGTASSASSSAAWSACCPAWAR